MWACWMCALLCTAKIYPKCEGQLQMQDKGNLKKKSKILNSSSPANLGFEKIA